MQPLHLLSLNLWLKALDLLGKSLEPSLAFCNLLALRLKTPLEVLKIAVYSNEHLAVDL